MTIYLYANDVERESAEAGRFDPAKKDPAINKRVRIVNAPKEGTRHHPMKGSAGYVIAKNHITGMYVVGLESSGVAMNIPAPNLVYL